MSDLPDVTLLALDGIPVELCEVTGRPLLLVFLRWLG